VVGILCKKQKRKELKSVRKPKRKYRYIGRAADLLSIIIKTLKHKPIQRIILSLDLYQKNGS